ncbi:stage II sporulation protein M [Ruficoccus sp. ZRK36]|uniref:stage II sporulation protein M n=1 Tax=Ruficoccus sp. ZRK36 TaxID=2866311 RepID=UPI001C730D78|nr:stage II sporulation protein M [Ruficoccus sp. ZRK36]QYY35102.1 stage II sporulation protein M [Ruficoccus sp. ZRK36]
MIIDTDKYISQQRPIWDEFERMLRLIEDNARTNFDLRQIQRLRYLQDVVSADLTRLRTFSAEPATTNYLESLVARGFSSIHENRSLSRLKFNPFKVLVEFAITVRRHSRLFYFVTATMFVGCILGGGIVAFFPEHKEIIMPFSHLLGDPSERVEMEEDAENSTHVSGHQSSFSATLMANNIRVAIFALTVGILYGVFTVVLVFYNGLILGAVAVDYILAGETTFLLGWLLPHGSVEIPAILFAAQGGLLIARTLIVKDGRLNLTARLKKNSRDIVMLIGGVVLLLVWAGIIEAFLSQYHEPVIPYSAKIAFGLLQLAALAGFIVMAGRTKKGARQ